MDNKLLTTINERLERLHTDSVLSISRTAKIADKCKYTSRQESDELLYVAKGQQQSHTLIDIAVFEIQEQINKYIDDQQEEIDQLKAQVELWEQKIREHAESVGNTHSKSCFYTAIAAKPLPAQSLAEHDINLVEQMIIGAERVEDYYAAKFLKGKLKLLKIIQKG